MIKRLAYIVLLLIFASGVSSATTRLSRHDLVTANAARCFAYAQLQKDTTKKHQQDEDQKKIKEIAKAIRQAKPEKIGSPDGTQDSKAKPKPPRQRRPEGLDRPPEIPRRNGN